ncbi:hypothetical protein Q31a_09900 [Aureliella helgolandensis]|uniref:Uncharacterized protein n=1 Tax=Aureliella helgolandensis TaxID=2527968 RepID=A0A518G297_9BACT|nr:hypothetical protein Q31a_09900 [Aureliella helgolandensis]
MRKGRDRIWTNRSIQKLSCDPVERIRWPMHFPLTPSPDSRLRRRGRGLQDFTAAVGYFGRRMGE